MELLIEVDLKGAEWVVVAYYSEDSRMLEVMERGFNPHVITGSAISGAEESYILREARLLGHTTDPDEIVFSRKQLNPPSGIFLPRTMSIYQVGKKSNHGLNYGLGYRNFSLNNEMPESDGKRCVDTYHLLYPGIKSGFHRRVRDLLISEGRLTNCFDEVYPVHEDLDDKVLRAAYSAVPQSTVSYITTQAIRRTYEVEIPALGECEPLANVHDSMLVQSAPSGPRPLRQLLRALDWAMTQRCEYYQRKFIIAREFKIGRNWGEAAMIEVAGLDLASVTEAWDAAAKAG